MTSPIYYLTEGLRMIKNSLNLKANGFHEYDGNAKDICMQIIEDCWNGRYFQTSTTNFPQFWTRDFGWCTASLLKLGHKERVEQTVLYALDVFSENGKITTTITPKGRPFNFPTFAVDSLPWLMHSITLIKNRALIEPFVPFLEKEIRLFYKKIIDKKTGLVKPKHFSSIKDYAIRKSSCYDNCMVASLSQSLDRLNLINPFKRFDYEKLIKKHFWNGNYFFDDLKKWSYIAADANIFPFYFDIIKDKRMLKSALEVVHHASLDLPLPVKYTPKNAPVKFIWSELFMHHYELDTTWTHMGPLYISLLKTVNPALAKKHIKAYTTMIESYKNYPEALTPRGKPFTSQLYHCDQGMLWAANYLTL